MIVLTSARRTTIFLLVGGIALAVGTPAYLGLTKPSVSFYLLQREIFLMQAVPYLIAAALWLPWRQAEASRITRVLAALLFAAALLLYIPMITGLWPTGGDMVGLGFAVIAIATLLSILMTTAVAFGILWLRRRGRKA